MSRPVDPAFRDLPSAVDYIVRSAEQPSLHLLEWDDAVMERVFGPVPDDSFEDEDDTEL